MKIKLFFLCLMAALSVPFAAHGQYYEDDEGYYDDDPEYELKKTAMDYYKDFSRWDIFIEPSVAVSEDTAFDPAGLKHVFYVRRFYFLAVPHKSDLKFQPQLLGPQLYAYGQKMPLEGKDPQYFQTIRKAVFPFAADYSANTPSSTIFQQYVEKKLDDDIQFIVDSLANWSINNLQSYYFRDTASKSYEDVIAVYIEQERTTTLSCLENEYINAIPQQKIPETREPIASQKSIEQLKKRAVKTQNGIYILPQGAILNQIADKPDDMTMHYYGEDYNNVIARMIVYKPVEERYEEFEEEYSVLTSTPASISGQSYFMLNDNTILLYPEEYTNDGEVDETYSHLAENREYVTAEDTVIVISSNKIEKMSLADCYNACLKDTLCTCKSTFPPILNVYIDDEKYDYDYYSECEGCYDKEAILEHLKEGSVLYDYFAKDFYLNDLRYKGARSIHYYPVSDRNPIETSWVEDEWANVPDTIHFSKAQSNRIKQLLRKKNQLQTQTRYLIVKAYDIAGKAEIPDGQICLTKSWWYGWKIDEEDTELPANDSSVSSSIDAEVEAVYQKKKASEDSDNAEKQENWEKKINQLQKKFDKLSTKIEQIDKAIEAITGHSLSSDDELY